MKKKLTIPLLLLVLFIWGWIFYKVMHANEEPITLPPITVRSQRANTAMGSNDSLAHNLFEGNYRDPFLADAFVEEVFFENFEMDENYELPMEEVYVDWSAIKYLGEVSNTRQGKQLVLLGIHDKDYMLKMGETREGVTLLRNDPTAVKISYQGKEHIITKVGGNENIE